MRKKSIYLKVFRYDPSTDYAPTYKNYEIQWREGLLLLKALKDIRDNLDETLAFRDFCCGCSWCMSCLMMVNGKAIRACSRLLKAGESLLIEPLKGKPVIKDLVVDYGIKMTTPQGTFKKMEGILVKKV